MAGSRFYSRRASRTLDVAEAVRIGLANGGAVAWSRVRRRARRQLPLLVAVILVGAPWIVLSEGFYVYEAETVGVRRLGSEEVLLASGLVGRHVLTVGSEAVEASLLSGLPTLKSAHVSCTITGKCTITVEERQPVAVLEEDGASYWIDEEGLVFPFEGTWSALLLVTGPLPRQEDGRLEEGIHAVLTELAAAGAQSDVVVRYTPEQGFVLADSRGWQVVLGCGPGTAEKLMVVERLVASLLERGLTPRLIDVRFPSAPYYSLADGS